MTVIGCRWFPQCHLGERSDTDRSRVAPFAMPETAALSRPAPATLSRLLATVDEHYDVGGKALLEHAYQLLEQLPEGPNTQALRQRGLDAATLLASMRLDPDALTAALLAPSLVMLQATPAWSTKLSADVVQLVTRVGELQRVRWDRLEQEAAERLRKMFLAMAKDVRVVLIVLALRVLLMRELTPGSDDDAQARHTAAETLKVYAPLANRLGVWQLKWELEDWSLRILEPQTFDDICRLLAERREQRQAFIDEVTKVLSEQLRKEGIEAEVKGRPKHIYSIYNKMRRKQISFEHVYDISAVRVLTHQLADCYAALGVVHSLWAPVPSEFDDYIAMPKGNGYQSLHTAVIGPRGRPVEVQIRTHEMHRYAEFGVAAHWAYKERRGLKNAANDKFLLLRQLIDWERQLNDPQQFVESLKTDLFEDQVFVFTPDGDIIDLPKGATPVDFAYRIHTEVGHRCRGARVNDQIVPLDYHLKTGDRVEILTQKQAQPNRDWMSPALGFLHTSSARSKVKHWFRQQGREPAIAAGKELVQKELARLELRPSMDQLAKELKFSSLEDLYAAVGYGDRRPQAISSAALQLEGLSEAPAAPPPKPTVKKPVAPSGVSIEGADRIWGQRARCCTPLPGDDVVGFISRGRGLVIHRRDCNAIQHSSEPERVVDVDWGTPANERHHVDVELLTRDRSGLLGDLLKLVSQLGAHIAEAQALSRRNSHSTLRLGLELKDSAHVSAVLERLDRHPEVVEVRRLKS